MKAWAEQHINATLLLAWLGSAAVFLILVLASPLGESVLLVASVGQYAITAAACGWALGRKGRSRHWLWLYLVGLGLVAVIVALASPSKAIRDRLSPPEAGGAA